MDNIVEKDTPNELLRSVMAQCSKWVEGEKHVPITDEDDAEGIEETLSDSPSMGRGIFNLQGQRINGLQKGLNIVDGKKVWVK